MVEDPKLAEHLAHFGINIASMTKVRTERREEESGSEGRERREEMRGEKGEQQEGGSTWLPAHIHWPHTLTPPHTHTPTHSH